MRQQWRQKTGSNTSQHLLALLVLMEISLLITIMGHRDMLPLSSKNRTSTTRVEGMYVKSKTTNYLVFIHVHFCLFWISLTVFFFSTMRVFGLWHNYFAKELLKILGIFDINKNLILLCLIYSYVALGQSMVMIQRMMRLLNLLSCWVEAKSLNGL